MSVNTAGTTPTSASVAVTPPAGTAAADFDSFQLAVCAGAATSGCPTVDCDAAKATSCELKDLTPGQAYTISATAVKAGVTSVVGQAASLRTPYP